MNQELKRLAQNARNRLMSKGENGTSGVKKMNAPLSPNVKFKVISTFESDEVFKNRTREVLEKGVLNPIGDLIDANYYRTLDEGKKQKYLLDVIEKFNRYKKEFERREQKLVY